jgi:protein-S-isoprenylcysteine O-methyltransferase Ste14
MASPRLAGFAEVSAGNSHREGKKGKKPVDECISRAVNSPGPVPTSFSSRSETMKRWLILAYGTICYLMFLGVFLYAIAFTGNFLVPVSLDSQPRSPVGFAILVNVVLLAVFAVQHSLMARPFFKRWIRRYIPSSAERSTYVLASNAAMLLLFACWQPIGPEIWRLTHPVAVAVVYALFFLGWGTVFISTCLINHFDLFGLRQVWLKFRGIPYQPLKFQTPGFYRYIRHPLYVGWLMVFWFSPVMSFSHLLFAVGCTVYILLAIHWEERDLMDALGVEYTRYRDEVPMFVPRLGVAARRGWLRNSSHSPR